MTILSTIIKIARGTGTSNFQDYQEKEHIIDPVVYDYILFIGQYPCVWVLTFPILVIPTALICIAVMGFAIALSFIFGGSKLYG